MMATPFDPCNEWLGIDSSDLVSPHLVLGVAANESDMLAIVRAADQRLARLRDVDPGSLAQVRDALVARVEQSRDTMLAGVAAVHSLGLGMAAATAPPAATSPAADIAPAPPVPMPPPVPPAVPGVAGASPAAPGFAPAPNPWSAPPAPAGLAAPPPPFQPFAVPAEPEPAVDPEPAAFEDVGIRVRRAPTYKRSSGTGGALFALAVLVAVAGALAAYVMKQPALMKKLFGVGKEVAVGSPDEGSKAGAERGVAGEPKTKSEDSPRPAGQAPGKHDGAATARSNPSSAALPGGNQTPPLKDGLDSLAGRKPGRQMDKGDESPAGDPKMRSNTPAPPGEPVKPGSADDSMPAKTAGSTTDTPKPDAPQPDQPPPAPVDTEQLDASLRAVFSFLRHHDFSGAAARIKKAAEIAATDPGAVNRVQLWERFVKYAREFNGHLDEALEAKKEGGEFQYKGRPVAIVEVDPKIFKYRDRGETHKVPRGEIPDDIAIAIVAEWFSGDGRAANHVFLGARELAKRKPDVDAARASWQQAADGGEAEGSVLLALLDDPVIRDLAK